MKRFAIALLAANVYAGDVVIDGEEKPALEVVECNIVSRQVFTCDDPIFDNFDFDQDGILDDQCIGVEYDPCDYPDSKTIAIIKEALTGNGCTNLDDLEEAKEREEACSGFSPRPAYCDE